MPPAVPCLYLLFCPHPPDPLPRRGRGRLKVYFAGGSAPGTPALNYLRHLQNLPRKCQAGGLLRRCLPCHRCPRRESCPPALPARPAAVPGGGGQGQGSKPKAGVGRRQRGKTSPCSCALQKNFQKPLTEAAQYDIIAKRCQDSGKGHGGVAQLARATGSYPVGHRFKSGLRYHIGQGSAVPYPSGTALVRGFPQARWSRGLRHRPFTAVTAVRICYGSPNETNPNCFVHRNRFGFVLPRKILIEVR